MTYVLHRLAEHDLVTAFRFYRATGSDRVALRFLEEFERVAELLDTHPGIGTPTQAGRRVFPFHRYPYWVMYKPIESGIRVLAVRHERQKPEHGTSRS